MTALAQAIEYTKFARGISESLLKDFPADQAHARIHPTHVPPIWIVGHIASTDGWLGSVLGAPGLGIPESYNALFAGGKKNPLPEAGACPPMSDVLGVYRSSREALLQWYERASPEALKAPLAEKTGGFFNDPVDALLKCGWHEGWHFGQFASIRKALGLPNVMS